MIGIKSIASYVPEECIDNYKQAEKFGETVQFIEKKIGAEKLPRLADKQDTSDIAAMAVKKLLNQEVNLNENDIDVLVVVTQNGDGEGLPHTSAIVQDKLGLSKSVASFDVSLGCSGYVYGLFILQSFMSVSGFKNGILVTADPYSKIVNTEDRTTSLLFGDAATATWLGENPLWTLEYSNYGTDGSGAENLKVADKILHMNGRQIFNFASTVVVSSIKEFLLNNNLVPEDVDLFCMHQGSAAVVDAISSKFPTVRERFLKGLKNTGNTVSSSIPLVLENVIKNTNKNKRILISGFGVGLSWATATMVATDK